MKKPVMLIGIDPGASGGVAYMIGNSVNTFKHPDTKTLSIWFKENSELYDAYCVIEHQEVRPQDVDDMRIFAMQKLVKQYNQTCALMMAHGIRYAAVRPKSWQKTLGIELKGTEYGMRKNKLKQHSAKQYPTVKVTLWNADALCLLQYALLKAKHEPQFYKSAEIR